MSLRRLLLVTTELLPAGAERIVFELATRLKRERWHVRVASLRSPGGVDGRVAEELRAAGVEVELLRMRGKFDLLGAARFLKLVRDFQPDILHGHLFHANLAARLLGSMGGARRVISTLHIVERRPRRLRPILQRVTASRDHATVCVSQAVADHARATLGAREPILRVIPNGIDLQRFSKTVDAAEARSSLGLPKESVIVSAVGRLTEQKGLQDLVEAFGRLASGLPNAHLVFAGAGEEEARLKAAVSARGLDGRVTFLGFRDDVPRVLAACDVFCMPSHWEGFGLALAEALAAGKACVSTDVDSLPEVMGDAGLLVPAKSPARLSDALASLLADRDARLDLGRRGPAQAAHFEVERMVRAYEQLYEELLLR